MAAAHASKGMGKGKGKGRGKGKADRGHPLPPPPPRLMSLHCQAGHSQSGAYAQADSSQPAPPVPAYPTGQVAYPTPSPLPRSSSPVAERYFTPVPAYPTGQVAYPAPPEAAYPTADPLDAAYPTDPVASTCASTPGPSGSQEHTSSGGRPSLDSRLEREFGIRLSPVEEVWQVEGPPLGRFPHPCRRLWSQVPWKVPAHRRRHGP